MSAQATGLDEKDVKEIQEEIKQVGKYIRYLELMGMAGASFADLDIKAVDSAVKNLQNAIKTGKGSKKRLSEAGKLLERSTKEVKGNCKNIAELAHKTTVEGCVPAESIGVRWELLSQILDD